MSHLLGHFLILIGVSGIYLASRRMSSTFRYHILRAGLALAIVLPILAMFSPQRLPVALPVSSSAVTWPAWIILFYLLIVGWRLGRLIWDYVATVRLVNALPKAEGYGLRIRHGRLPFTFGLLWPTIVLPAEGNDLLFEHERIHARRRDPFWLVLSELTRAVFFASPLHHFYACWLEREMELSCDESVLAVFPERKREYGELLFAYATGAPGRLVSAASKYNLSRRIEAMSQVKLNHVLLRSVIVLFVALLSLVAATVAVASPSSPSVQEIFGDRVMTVQAKKTSVRDLLAFVLRSQNIKFQFAPGAGIGRPVSVQVIAGKVAEIFDFLIVEGSLTYVVNEDGVLQIGTAPIH